MGHGTESQQKKILMYSPHICNNTSSKRETKELGLKLLQKIIISKLITGYYLKMDTRLVLGESGLEF